jgi:hypothetical protein
MDIAPGDLSNDSDMNLEASVCFILAVSLDEQAPLSNGVSSRPAFFKINSADLNALF